MCFLFVQNMILLKKLFQVWIKNREICLIWLDLQLPSLSLCCSVFAFAELYFLISWKSSNRRIRQNTAEVWSNPPTSHTTGISLVSQSRSAEHTHSVIFCAAYPYYKFNWILAKRMYYVFGFQIWIFLHKFCCRVQNT